MMTLEEMKAVDIRTVDPETLVDIRDVHIQHPVLVPGKTFLSYLKVSIAQ